LDSIKGDGRIINVSSMVHQSARFDLQNLQGEKFFDGYNAYGCSKLENILFTIQLSKILEGSKLTVNALHPGVVSTKLLKAAMGSGSWGSSLKEGAATSVYLAISDEVKNISGKYFVNSKVRTPSADALDPVIQDKLWEASEKLI
jgi:NAD(P)-dependent dehydrogenase (short-subunit alcohol dehydrogenase family)